MITFKIGQGPLGSDTNQALIAFSAGNPDENQQVQQIAQAFEPKLGALMKAADFTGKSGSLFILPLATDQGVRTLFIAGLGSGVVPMETYRRALGKVIKAVQSRKLCSVTLIMPPSATVVSSPELLTQETVVTAAMAEYHFDEFITNPERKVCNELTLELISHDTGDMRAAVERGSIIAQGVNQARRWVDLPSITLTPKHMVERAQEIAKKYNLQFTAFGEQEIINMGMGGLAGVAAGSDQDCALVILEYKTSKANAPTIALVGKGVTFDSGGLSIKPADSMETMKDDMAGAAAVINTMKILAQLKPEVNVIGIAPLTENLPSGKAIKPGDILRFYNGKTAEVRNTDAEGRLILADALSYAVKHYKPDAMIDIATLTGACAYALGPFFAGMMSKHDELAAKVKRAGDRSGDHVWQLPFTDDYKVAVRSQVADICNIGSRKYRAGAITAGFFLHEFVGDTPWVHLDIAGTAFEVPDISYYSHGATGFGVRLFVDLIMKWQE